MKTPKDYLQQPYARVVIPVDQTGYHAEILEFPGCYAQGDSPADAYSNLERAAESWIEACISQGQEIPEPSSNLTFSGNVSLRLPRSIHRQASRFADRDATSLNTYLVSAVSARVGAEELYSVLAQRLEQRLFNVTCTAYAFAHEWFQWDRPTEPMRIEQRATTTSATSNQRMLSSTGR